MHLVVTENKFLVDFTKKVRMRHQNVFAHPETDEASIAGKNTSRVVSNYVANCVPKCVNIQGHLLQTYSAAFVDGSQDFPGMMKSLGEYMS